MGINKLKFIFIFILCNFSLITCQNNKVEEKFKWTGTISAPQEYPIEVYSGAIISDDFTYAFDAIWGTQNTGWGENGGLMNVSEEQMEIPHQLEFTWYSLAEEKFYTGKWDLDYKKIYSLFKEGFKSYHSGKYITKTYDEFIIGLAPKGRVVLWAMGEKEQREIGVFQAHDTIITKEQAYEDAQYMLETDYAKKRLKSDFVMSSDIKENFTLNGFPPANIYDIFRELYEWKPKVELPTGYTLTEIYISTCNGESENVISEIGETIKNKNRAIPDRLSIGFKDKNGKQYGASVVFTENKNYWKNYVQKGLKTIPLDFYLNEINKLFKENINPKETSEIIFKIEPESKNIELYIQQMGKSIPMKNNLRLIY